MTVKLFILYRYFLVNIIIKSYPPCVLNKKPPYDAVISVFSVFIFHLLIYDFAMSLTMSLTARQQVIKKCAAQVIKELGTEVKAEKALYSKRNYAQGNKMKPKDYFYLRLAEIKQKHRLRLQRLGIADEWVDELMEKQFKVCRKNGRGHTGVSRRNC